MGGCALGWGRTGAPRGSWRNDPGGGPWTGAGARMVEAGPDRYV